MIVETDDQGRVVSVMLSRSSGNAALDRAALEQARRRVRLTNVRAGEGYPIDIDFVQPNSENARRVRERGDRRSITVSDPEPVVETPASTVTNSAASEERSPAVEKPVSSTEPSPVSEEPSPASTEAMPPSEPSPGTELTHVREKLYHLPSERLGLGLG